MMQKLSKGFPDAVGWRPPVVALVGMGMGREDLSVRALRWIEQADVLAGGRRHVGAFSGHRGERLIFEGPLEESLAQVEERSRTARVAVLASGDPFFFGVGRRLLRCVGSGRLVVLPNVTSVQTLFARLGRPWEDVRTVSLHGRDEGASGGWLRVVEDCPALALFTDPRHTPDWIARQLLEAGVEGRVLVVGENLGLPTECVRRCTLQEAAELTWSPLNVVVVLAEEREKDESESTSTASGSSDEVDLHPHSTPSGVSSLEVPSSLRAGINPAPTAHNESAEETVGAGFIPARCGMKDTSGLKDDHPYPSPAEGRKPIRGPLFGLPEEAFAHEAGLITKLEVRAVVLALLHIEPDLVLWDLGAGSGSVAVEASRLAPLRRVIAVERNPERFRQLQENCHRLGGGAVEARLGPAATILPELPDPDRVFVGGSGGDLSEILHSVAGRLRPGGRMVLTAVMLDTLEAARRFWEGKPFDVSVTQLQINRSQALAGSLRLEPLNPVFILTVSRV